MANLASTGGRLSARWVGTEEQIGGIVQVDVRGRQGRAGRGSTPRWSLQYFSTHAPNGSDAIATSADAVVGAAALLLGVRRNVVAGEGPDEEGGGDQGPIGREIPKSKTDNHQISFPR